MAVLSPKVRRFTGLMTVVVFGLMGVTFLADGYVWTGGVLCLAALLRTILLIRQW